MTTIRSAEAEASTRAIQIAVAESDGGMAAARNTPRRNCPYGDPVLRAAWCAAYDAAAAARD